MFRLSLFLLVTFSFAALAQPKISREEKLKLDRKKVEADGFWIYNDLAKGIDEAKKTGKPLVVGLRCIPCEECVKLDDELVDRDPVIRPLLEKFVCVRIISTNGLDLSLFQFDTDQSFTMFFLNSDGTIYGRFGTRSHRTNWVGDVSLPGLAKALKGALDLHGGYPKNKDMLAAKRGGAPEFPSPEKYPTLSAKYGPKLAETGNVVQSCIHCHQIGDAQREYYRKKKEPIPETVLFPYPHPKSIGLILDPKEIAAVEKVEKGTLAEKAGFQAKDVIAKLAGQPLLSIADVQWVLHSVPADGGSVKAEVKRDGKTQEITLTLPDGWRRLGEISWRASAWGLRRMAEGGLMLEDITAVERTMAGAPADGMALRVKFMGQYNLHATAKNSGFQVGDILIEWDGKTDLKRDSDVLAYGVTAKKTGDKVTVTVLRGGKKVTLMLPMQE